MAVARVVAQVVAAGCVLAMAGASLTLTPDAVAATAVTVSISVEAGTHHALGPMPIRVSVADGASPVPGASVVLLGTGPGGAQVASRPEVTGATGAATATVVPAAFGAWTWRARVTVAGDATVSEDVVTTVSPADVVVRLAASDAEVESGDPATVTAAVFVNGRRRAGVPLLVSSSSGRLASVVTEADGRVSVRVPTTEPRYWRLIARVDGSPAWRRTESGPVRLRVVPARVVLRQSVPESVTSEAAFAVRGIVTTRGGSAVSGALVSLWVRARGQGTWEKQDQDRTSAAGIAAMRATVWRGAVLRMTVAATSRTRTGESGNRSVRANPAFDRVKSPAGAPQPQVVYPEGPRPVGRGANAVVSRIPDTVWKSMQGLSWSPGCVPRNDLRYVTVNHIGFDGYRYRGELVVRADAAEATAAVFTRLFEIGYPIRSMVLPDRFGRNPLGPGADDYASMAADNTSGFNCRYVVGKEALHAWSPHARGRAIDINTWENPYVAPTGTFPNSWWLSRSISHPAMLTRGSRAVRILTDHGFSWGGSYRDYQHFQRD